MENMTIREARDIVAKLLKERRALEKFAEVLNEVDKIEQTGVELQARVDRLILAEKDALDRTAAHEKAIHDMSIAHEKAKSAVEKTINESIEDAKKEAEKIISDAVNKAASIVKEADDSRVAQNAVIDSRSKVIEDLDRKIEEDRAALLSINEKIRAANEDLEKIDKVKKEALKALSG